jgi:DNA polymerase-3 subunit alpha
MERMHGGINRKAFETLLMSGCFDSFGFDRAQYSLPTRNGEPFIDAIIRYADLYNRDSLDEGASLFGGMEEIKPVRPEMPKMEGEPNLQEALRQEKELVGMYLSSHPLDQYRFEINNFASIPMSQVKELEATCTQERKKASVRLAGLISETQVLSTKTGKPFSKTLLEDFEGSYELALFGKDHEGFLPFLKKGNALYIEGEIQEKYRSTPEKEPAPFVFRPKKISLLGNVSETLLKDFVIHLTMDQINGGIGKKMTKVLRAYKGNTPVCLCISEPEKDLYVEMESRNFSVKVSEPLIFDLEELGLRCKARSK